MFFDIWNKTEKPPTPKKTWEADFTNIHFWAKPPQELIEYLDGLSWKDTLTKQANLTERLTYKIAQHYQLSTENVMLFPYIESAILDVAKLFYDEKISYYLPCQAYYEQVIQIAGGIERTHNFRKTNYNADLVFLDNPNFPDGQVIYIDELENILESNPRTLFCINEYLISYADDLGTATSLVKHYKNLIVITSQAKVCGISGLEVAYILANKKWIRKLKAINVTPNLSTPNLLALEFLMGLENFGINPIIENLPAKRRTFARKISAITGLRALSTQTHFFLCEMIGKRLYSLKNYLSKNYDINIYPEGDDKIEGLPKNYFGISLLSDEENELMLEVLQGFMER